MLKLLYIFIFVIAPFLAWADDPECGSLDNHYGPFDYTKLDLREKKLRIVEAYHFNSDVERLKKGVSGRIIDDLNYTLRTSPNHHRALNAVTRYQLLKGDMRGHLSAECYLDRALRFAPHDGVVHMINGNFLFKKDDLESALDSYKKALGIMPKSPELNYNIGLLYVKQKNYSAARKYAISAYTLNYPLRGLREKLEKAGFWSKKENEIIKKSKVKKSNI